jgi:outer membrane lipoprotein-sorting protein
MGYLFGVVGASGQAAPAKTASGQTAPAKKPQTAASKTVPKPGAQMAEQAFRSITVLKGISVDEFMDTMGFFSASLSYNCTDCHGEDAVDDWANFAKDTPTKTTARKMIVMVKFINQTQFGGARMITCYTCHGGDAHPRITPSLALQYSTPPDDPNELVARAGGSGLPTADALFNKYFEASGGAQRVAALTSLAAKGTYSGYDTDNQKVPVDIYAKAPAQMTMIVHANLGDSVRVFNGRTGWIASPDRPVPLMPLTGGDVIGAKFDATLVFATGIKQLFPEWRVAETTIDDKDVYMAEGIAPGQLPLRLYFDEKSGLLVRAVRLANTVVGFNPTQLDFSDYRDVAGVKVPFHRVTTWTDNQATIDLDTIQPNAAIDAAKFAQPPPAAAAKVGH